MAFAMCSANFFARIRSDFMCGREASRADFDTIAFLVTFMVVMLTAYRAVFRGDVYIEGFVLFSYDAVVKAGVGIHEGLSVVRCEE